MPGLVSCFILIWCHLFVPGAWAGCDKWLRTLSDPALQHVFPCTRWFSSSGKSSQGCSWLLNVTTGQAWCWACYIHHHLALSENHTALKSGQHCVSGNEHCQIESLDSEGHNSAFTCTGDRRGRQCYAQIPLHHFFCIISVRFPGWGCSPLFEDCSWATGAILLAGSESRKFTSLLGTRLWKLSSLAPGWDNSEA